MSSNNAPIDLQIGDFVDLEAQPHQAKIVVTITPQCIQLKDPLATHIDNILYRPSRIKGFRTLTKLKEYSNPNIGYIRKVKTSTQQIHQLKQTIKQIMAAPLSFSPKQLIQTLRGRHYYTMHSLMMNPIDSEEAYLCVVSYLSLHRESFIKFMITVDFSSYDASNIYSSSMNALCSSYPELIELTEIATGVASEFSQFRKNSEQFYKKEVFEQEVQEWLETQFLVNFVQAKVHTFPAPLLILMIASLHKISRGFQIEFSEPLGSCFESLYQALLVRLSKQPPPLREVNNLSKFISTLFKTIHKTLQLSSSLSSSKIKITDSSLTEKLQSCGEEPQNHIISPDKMKEQSESFLPAPLSCQQFSKAKELEFKFHLAFSYLNHGLKENCFTQINACMTEIAKDCKVKQEVAHLQQNWPRIGVLFLKLVREKGFFEELLKINNFVTSMVSVRSILLKFFPYLPRQISVACIKQSKSSILKQVLSQRPVFREEFYIWLCQYVCDLKVEQNQLKDVNELIKHIQPSLKNRPTFPNCSLWRQRLLEKQYELAISMKNVEFNIFDNLFTLQDQIKAKVFNFYMQSHVLPHLSQLLQHFHQFLLFKYTNYNRITQKQFQMMLNPMLLKEKQAAIYERRKMSIINVLHLQFTQGADKICYFSLLSKFISYYSHPQSNKSLMINNWGNFSVYPTSILSQKAFFESLTQEFIKQIFPKLIPFSSELDIKLSNLLFCKLNSLKAAILLDDKLQITTVTDSLDYFEEIIQGLYYLPKEQIKILQKYVEIYFKAASQHIFYRMLDQFLAIIIKNQAAGPEANFLYKRLKCRLYLSPQKNESLPQEVKLKFTNYSVFEKFQDLLGNFDNDPYRRLIAQEVTNTSIVMQARNNDGIYAIKLKLAFRVNRDPSEIVFLDKDGNRLPDEIEKRNIGSSMYLFAQENYYRQLKNQGKIPVVPINFKVIPERSPAHQSLLSCTVDLFMLLPKTFVILSGVDFRIEKWASFDESLAIAQLFQKAVTEGDISQISAKSTFAVTSLLDYFLWRKKPEELSKYDFCCLLSLLKRIENESDILFNLKIVYLIYSSSNFKEGFRDQLLSSLLFLEPADLRTSCLYEQKSYDLLTDLVYIILQQYPKGALQFYFTTQMLEKFYEIETCYNSFKRHWKNIFQESTFEEKIEILNTIEDRMLKYPQNFKELGSLIEKTEDADLICLYETTLERMARQVVLLNSVKVTGHYLKISCSLLNNCWEFIEKEIRCDYLVHREFVLFLRDNFYEYVFHIPDFIFGLILYCMNQSSHRDAFMQFFQAEISQQEWQKREYLEGGRRYREPQAQGYVGLVNCFNTCYANSLFQQLFHNEHFSKELLATDWPRSDVQKQDLILQLKKIFVHLKESQHPYQNRNFFDSAFKLCDGYPVQTTIQMDVDEFRNLLFNHLQEIIPKNMFWSRIFEGKEESQIKCLECLNVSSTLETYNSICLSVQDFTNLESSFEAHHQPLILEKDNAYFCEKCNRKVRAQKSLIIKSLPPCLIFVLKRFEYVADKGFRRKLNNYFEFPMDEIQLEGGRNYSLKGIISHMGYSESGHYISYVKLKGQWYEFNDARVRQLSEEDVKLNSYGSLRGSQKSTVTERTAYLLFYESIEQPLLEAGMEIQCPMVGVEEQLAKIRLEKRLLNKEIAYLNHHFLQFLIRLVFHYPTIDSLHLLYLGLVDISFKLRFPEGNEGQLYQDKILKALHLLARSQNSLSFMWQNYSLERTLVLINSPILIEYKAALAYLLAENCPPNADNLAQVLDLCLACIYQARVDVSSYFAIMHYLALKYEEAAQYLHSQRIIGRILDLTFMGLTSQETRNKLKASCTANFEKTVKFQLTQIKQQLRYHKWALLVYMLEKYQQNLDQSQIKYLSLQQNTCFMQRVIDQSRTKPTMHYVGQYFCLLIKKYEIDFATKLLGVIRDGVSKEKGDSFRCYIVILQWILSVKNKDHELRNKNAVNIIYKMLQHHGFANDNTFEYLWLWVLKIANGNEVLRKQISSNRTLFEFLYFKSYNTSSFYKTQRNNALPIKTRHRLHHLPIPLFSTEFLSLYNKRIQNTKAVLNRIELPFFTSDMVVEELTVQQNIKTNTRINRFYDVTQQFEEYTVLWAIGDLIAIQTPIPKEKFPNSVLLLKGDERVFIKEQNEQTSKKQKGTESFMKESNGSDELSESAVKKEQKEQAEVKQALQQE